MPRIKRTPRAVLQDYKNGIQSLEESVRALELWCGRTVRKAEIQSFGEGREHQQRISGEGVTWGKESQAEHRLQLGF